MLRTVVMAAMCIGLVACGGGSQSSKRTATSRAASTPHTTARTERQQKGKKASTRPDTTRAKNPLTN
jgi:Flp pilus assembly protein TadD